MTLIWDRHDTDLGQIWGRQVRMGAEGRVTENTCQAMRLGSG
jgi:hypothetical protein